MIRVGQVGGAYGTDGAVKVVPLTDFADRFNAGSILVIEGTERKVEWSRPGHPGVVVKFSGINDRSATESIRGRYLEVPEAEVRPLDDGRFYHHQLVGLHVRTESGRDLGTIVEILERPANDVWVSHLGDDEHLIPATRDAVQEVDLAEAVVVVKDWLFSVEEA